MKNKSDQATVAKLTLEELKQSIEVLRQSLFQQRLSLITAEDTNSSKVKVIRKQIARRMQQISCFTKAEVSANA
jgi:ribosomal protein L29